MKKKILLSVLTLFVLSVFAVKVNAQESLLGVGNDVAAKAPTTIPSSGTTMYATLSDSFDFSRVEFASTGSTAMYGKSDLKKIFLGGQDLGKLQSSELNINVLKDYFSAYCLDGNAKYPGFGIYTNYGAQGFYAQYAIYANPSSTAEQKAAAGQAMIHQMVVAAFVNDTAKTKSIVQKYKDASIGPILTFEFADGTTVEDFSMESLKSNPMKKRNVNVTHVEYDGEGEDVNVALSFTALDILFDKYVVQDNLDSKYNHALWILEHSYPSLTLEESLAAAGVNYDTLKTQIAAVQATDSAKTGSATTVSGLSGDNLTKYVENYVYGTVQYAIWRVYDGVVEDDGSKLGDSIKTSGLSELDKLYKYLIDTSRNYNGYNTYKYNDTITTSAPASGKEIFKQDSSNYTFGPYKVTYDALSTSEIKLAKEDKDNANIKIVDKDGKEITSIANGGQYYVQVAKNAKIGNVKVNYTVEKVSTFTPSGNRGRIYNPNYVNAQNVITAGKIGVKSITGQFDITTNPKTGVENVGVLLMVTLVAFSLGYLVLSYKAKPVGLN